MDVIASAEFLLAWHASVPDDDDTARVRSTLETGMFVIYARPFTSGLQMFSSARRLTSEQRDLHDQILELRHSVYAHSDDSPWREALDNPLGDFLVSWLYPTPKLLEQVLDLARAQLVGFLASLEELEEQLGALIQR